MAIFQPRAGQKLQRYEIFPLEGLNGIVGDNLAKRGEFNLLENYRSNKIGWLDKRLGHQIFGAGITASANYGLFDFVIDNRHILIRVSTVNGVTSIYRFSEQNNGWVQLLNLGTGLSTSECDFAIAIKRCFITNGVDNNRYIENNGSTVTDSTNVNGNLYNSPIASLVCSYKSRIYLGDYLNLDGSRERTGICYSSVPLGIMGLVLGDQASPLSTLAVTSAQYIGAAGQVDRLDIYRANTKIATVAAIRIDNVTIQISDDGTNPTSHNYSGPNLLSNDELWPYNTHDSEKQIRWDNRATGVGVRTYDGFFNTSSEDLTDLQTVNNNLLIFTKNSITLWNGSALRPLDLNIGSISRRAFAKVLGQAIFLHYTGIYSTTGGSPTLLSAKIQPIFNGVDKIALESACAAIDGLSYFVHIGQVTFYNADNSVKRILNDVVIEYNLRQANFFIHTDVPMSHFISYQQKGQIKLLFAKRATPWATVSDLTFLQDTASVFIFPELLNVSDSTSTSEYVDILQESLNSLQQREFVTTSEGTGNGLTVKILNVGQ